MSWVDSAVNGLVGAVITGGLGGFALWRADRSRRQRQPELLDQLNEAYQAEIAYLRTELAKCQAQRRRHQ